MPMGFWGRIIVVDLSSNDVKIETLDEEYYKNSLGGVGLGAKYLYENMKPNADPLGPENILGFLPGLFNGTGIPFSSRYTVVAKSPLTNTWGDANSGGYFGYRFKKAGYDALFVKGIANKPIYISISEEEVKIKDASKLWGKSAREVELILKAEEFEGKKAGVASIGVPGEKLSLISCIMNDHGRAAARSGLGAVMGSKKLKAVVVTGNKNLPIHDQAKLKDINKKYMNEFKQVKKSKFAAFMMRLFNPLVPYMLKKGAAGAAAKAPRGVMTAQFKDMGTTMSASMQSQMGDSPVKNWKGVGYLDFPFRSKAAKISDVNYKEFWTKKYACANCVLGCSAVLNVTKGKYKIGETHRPEYETIASFGSILLNNDIETLLYANEICNSQGFDTISAGSTIAFAMECFEHNILTLKETDGIDLTWGNSEGIIKVLEKMVHRDGIGDLLADGAKVAADKLGKGAEEYAMHVHGQDIAMHDPRLNIGFASTYVADPTPGKHTPGGTGIPETGLPLIFPEKGEIPPLPNDSYEEKGRYQKILSIAMLLLNMVGICGFSGWPGIRMPISEYINAITGWELSFEDTSLSGETIMNLRQAFNVREGIKPSDFKLPKRVLGLPPLENGPTKNVTVDVDTLVNDYFQNMDWDMNTGKPSKEKLKELGLDMVIKDLY